MAAVALVSAKAGSAADTAADTNNSKVATVEVTVSKAVTVVDTVNSKDTVNKAAMVSKLTARPRPAPAVPFRTGGKRSTLATVGRCTIGT